MDILLDNKGDLFISKDGDIALGNSVAQKIRIKLLWFEGEWRWDKSLGIPYFEGLLIKNPDTDSFESIIRSAIFDVEEVTEVREVSIIYDNEKRTAVIKYVALTEQETIKEEVKLRWKLTE